MKEVLIDLKKTVPYTDIVSGGAQGADRGARQFALDSKIPIQEFLPDYQCYPGYLAPLKRNELIVNACDAMVAFPTSQSKGTFHAINLAKKAKKPVYVFDS